MSQFGLSLLRLSVIFLRNTIGCINTPYITFRKLSEEKSDSRSTFFIFFFVALYFAFASVIRIGRQNPFLLTIKFNTLAFSWTVGFSGIILLLYLLGKLIGGRSSLKSLFILYSYSLMPTLIWFFFTSLMYIFLPPPRTVSLPGKIYSLVFISFSIFLAYWKLILYYLTLRFGLRLDLVRIAFVTLFLTPFVVSYSIFMYRLGVFRIPFL